MANNQSSNYQAKVSDYENKVKRYFKRNFYLNIMDGSFFAFGLGFVSRTTILPLFISNLTDSKFLISLITAIMMFGTSSPQLLAAKKGEGLSRKKGMVVFTAVFQRVPWIILAIATYFLAGSNHKLLLIIFFAAWSIHSFGTGFLIPFWFEMITKIIPLTRRGRFFGYRGFLSSILGTVSAFAAKYIIENYSFKDSFIILFIFAFIFLLMSYLALLFVKEPASLIVRENSSFKDYFKRLPVIVKQKVNYRNFLISVVFIQFIGMSSGLFTVAGIDRMNLSGVSAGEIVGLFTILFVISQSFTNIIWGHIADRWGHKIVILFTAIFNGLGVFIAIFAQTPFMFYLVFIFTGIALGGTLVSFNSLVSEFAPLDEIPTYVGLANTIKGLLVTVISLLGGLIVDLFNFKVVFTISFLCIGLGVYLLMFRVKEPRFENE